MPSIRSRVRHHILQRSLAIYLKPRPRADLVRLGSSYGGWWVPESVATPGSVAYCAGAGEDITFDLELHRRGCHVTVFDPTPRAIAYVEANAPLDSQFRFFPIGWWGTTTDLRFYVPANPAHVSHSAANLQQTTDYFIARVEPVHQLMVELGDARVNLIKMDIEGAECAVIDSLLQNGPLPEVLCVEFDQPQPPRQTIIAVRKLQNAGYTLNKVDVWNYTFTR